MTGNKKTTTKELMGNSRKIKHLPSNRKPKELDQNQPELDLRIERQAEIEGSEMKQQQVEYWCLKSEHMTGSHRGYQSAIDLWSHSKYRQQRNGDPFGSPSECVWIVPHVNPWLLDWG